jgi:hypothetical protein
VCKSINYAAIQNSWPLTMGSWQTRKMKGFNDLIVYNKTFSLAMKIYHITKNFSKDELYSLTNQIRKASHFVC